MKYSTQHEHQIIEKVGPLLQQAKPINEICDLMNKEGPWPKVSEYWTSQNLLSWIHQRRKQISSKFPIEWPRDVRPVLNQEEDIQKQLVEWADTHRREWCQLSLGYLYNLSKNIDAGTIQYSEASGDVESFEEILTDPKLANKDKVSRILTFIATGLTCGP